MDLDTRERRIVMNKLTYEELEAKCAEMRGALTEILCFVELLDYDETRYWTDLITHSLSNSCGKGWISPEKAQRLREALQRIIGQCELSESTARDKILSMAIKHEAKQALEETK